MPERARGRSSPSFSVFDAVADPVTVQDTSGALVYVNPPAAEAMGFTSPREVLSAPLDELMRRFAIYDRDGSPFPQEQLPGRLALAGLEPDEVVVRWRQKDVDGDRWTAITARPLFDDGGRVAFAVNLFRDITDRLGAQEEARVRALQQAAVAALGNRALEPGSLDEVMEEAARLIADTLGVDLSQVLELQTHGSSFEVRAGAGWREAGAAAAAVSASSSSLPGYTLLSRVPVIMEDLRTEARFAGSPILHEHQVVSGVCVPIPGGKRPFGAVTAYATQRRSFTEDDVHFLEALANVLGTAIERKQAEAARAELLAAERAAREEAERARERLAFLAEASEVLASSLNLVQTLRRVARLAVPRLADWCAVELLNGDGGLEPVVVMHSDPEKVEWAREFRKRYPPDLTTDRGVARVLRTGEPELYPEISTRLLEESWTDPEHLDQVRKLAPRSAMILPLRARGRTFGTMTFVTAESEVRYDEGDLAFAMDLSRRAALAIDNARLYEERSHVAHTLQQSLLPPTLPELPGIETAARYRSGGEAGEVGGDFYDLFEVGGDTWIAVMGDVCGRGVEAAALTGVARQTIRGVATRKRQPSRVLRALNETLLPQTPDMRFCTVACARITLDGARPQVAVSVGGHPLPMVLHADGKVEQVGTPGTLLGVFPNPELEDRFTELRPGDALLLCTDGVTEAFETRDQPGELGLAKLLEGCAGLGASAIADRVERGAVAAQASPSRDDMAILVLRAA